MSIDDYQKRKKKESNPDTEIHSNKNMKNNSFKV